MSFSYVSAESLNLLDENGWPPLIATGSEHGAHHQKSIRSIKQTENLPLNMKQFYFLVRTQYFIDHFQVEDGPSDLSGFIKLVLELNLLVSDSPIH